ncbi:MAG: hypothetical protein P8Q25_04710 [Porticoccaceae bacterium]|jgi:uncharacterized low-complexity protein|nr:hypothetical protein [Porticoccaceae bacterium]
MSKQTIKPLSAAVGIAFAATMALSPATSAAGNPFQADQLSSGYDLAGNRAEGKCGEGKCGGEKAEGEGKCGEGKCGEGKPSGEKAEGEGKCGEGKCGGA